MTTHFNKITKGKLTSTFLIGILIIVISNIVVGIISFQYIGFQFSHLSFSELQNTLKNPPFYSKLFTFSLMLIGILSQLVAGYFVGRRLKQKGWLYGGVLGIIIFILSIIFSVAPLLLPSIFFGSGITGNIVQSIKDKTLNDVFVNAPRKLLESTIIIGIGGWLGEYFAKKRS